ncbi:T9SS type A sorting domain-containing protein [Chryseobacterium sp. CH21]|uniref:T9SS type A sorting domain-containing protein n=1 Tax=Chryseobacterium sp. CH21 TaxID=713556 RepID=UPI001E2D1561|nr:T9SS type A sorting domain-containing protein [Chryseobacterium sp. CH21]
MNTIGNIDSGLPLTLNQDGTNAYGINLAASYKDVRIWKSALPNDVIVNWANQDITPSHPYYSQLVANWRCNGTSGNTLTDSSPNTNNMMITGSPTYNAGTVNNFKVYDYTSTTRETDHFPTVLNWLCIPVESSWGIDGVNRIPECSKGVLGAKETKVVADDFKIYPNPVSTFIGIQYKSEDKEIKAEIIDGKGALVSTSNLKSSRGFYDEKINIGSLPAGVYFIKIKGSKNSQTKTFIKK